ncbi:MAG: ribonuclease HI family protein [Candidatus Glassbacteria bacterium]|nr:ribonuclease HI family protein [Candidatus Glassbacteria bacterium]
MALFEVRLVPGIAAGGSILLARECMEQPRLFLAGEETWQDFLKDFIGSVLGEVKFRCRLRGIKTLAGETPVLEVFIDCVLEAGQPPEPLEKGFLWVKREGAPVRQAPPPLKRTGEPDPEQEVELYTDGASRGNPGPAGIGVLLVQKGTGYEEEYCRCLGRATNNVAEYSALVEGLALAVERGARKVVHFSDSELLVKQLKGEYKIKSDMLKMLLYQARDIISGLGSFSTAHIGRELNSRADELAGRAITRAGNGIEESFNDRPDGGKEDE